MNSEKTGRGGPDACKPGVSAVIECVEAYNGFFGIGLLARAQAHHERGLPGRMSP